MLDLNTFPPSLHVICPLGVVLGICVFLKCRRLRPDDEFAGAIPMSVIVGFSIGLYFAVAFIVSLTQATTSTLEDRLKPTIGQFLADHSIEEFEDWFTCDDFSRVGKLSNDFSKHDLRSTSLVEDEKANEFHCYFDFRGCAHHFIVNLEDKQMKWID